MKGDREGLVPFGAALLGVAVLLAVVALQGLAQETEQTYSHQVRASLTNIPKKDLGKRNPLEADPEAAAAGGKLYEQHCAECHGKKAGGTKRAPSLVGREVQQAPPGALFWVVTNGVVRRGMPVWSKLPEPERWQIVTFLKSLKGEHTDKQNGR